MYLHKVTPAWGLPGFYHQSTTTVFIPSMPGRGCHLPGVPVRVLMPVRSHDVLSMHGYRTDASQVWLDRQLAPARHDNDPGKRHPGIVPIDGIVHTCSCSCTDSNA
jgi:hypothetical protein